MTKKEPEGNGLRMWGKVLAATTHARQRVADKYWDLREGGNGMDSMIFSSVRLADMG